MGRPARMWFRKPRNTWYATINGKQTNLGPDKAAAEKQFHLLKSQDEPVTQRHGITAVELLDKFLVWTQENKAPATFKWYSKHLQRFIDQLPNQSIGASGVKPFHVYEACKKSWSDSYKRGFMVASQRAFKWAMVQGYIEKSPLTNLEKPSATRREDYPTKADFDAMLEHVRDGFRDVLNFLWETGARPQEMRAIEGRHYIDGKIQFPVKESKGKKRARVIYLNDAAKEIIEQRLNDGFVFTNRNGNPWNAFSINCRMYRIGKKTGKHFCAYQIRHSFATRMLEAGLDHVTVSRLLGHVDASVLAKIYAHIGEKNDYLLTALKRVS